jgi:hypothetical protein
VELAVDGNNEEMTRKRSKGKRPSPTPSARTIARAMLGTAILYNKLTRAGTAAKAKAAMPPGRGPGKSCQCKGRCPCHRGNASPLRALGTMSVGATALGATALGAVAVGALAIGALAIRRLAIKRGDVERLDIRELKVKRLEVDELLVREETRSQPSSPPPPHGGPQPSHGGPGEPPAGGPGSPPGPMPA